MNQEPTAPPRWSSRSIANRFQHGFFYALIRLGGRRPAYAFLRLVAAWYTLLRPSVRQRSLPYLRRRFPGATPLQLLRHGYHLSCRFGEVLIDRACLGILGPTAGQARFTKGREDLPALLQEGRGCILLGAHVGCWQVAMAGIDFLRTPVNMLLHREPGDLDRHWFEHRGEDTPFRLIDPAGPLGGAVETAAALRRGEVLCLMGDRVGPSGEPARGTLSLPFLGAPAPFPVSAFRLAAATGAPVAVLLTHACGPGEYELELAGVIRVPGPLAREPEACAPYLRQYVALLEDYCRRHPYQFFNFYDMWDKPEER